MTGEPTGRRPRVVVVGAGFAGVAAARGLHRRLGAAAEVVVVNPVDHFLYLPLLPEVAAGTLEPRRVAVSLRAALPGARLVLGEVDRIDLAGHRLSWTDPDSGSGVLEYDRLVLAVGSVTRLLPVPGVAENAHGFRSIPEAMYLRDHLVRQVELAAAHPDPAERAARCTFVVVGAGYTGTEVAAQGALLTAELARRYGTELGGQRMRWVLVDNAPRVLPQLDEHLSRTADRVLRQRGVEIRTGTTVAEATADRVQLSTGDHLDTRTLVWCVGVRPDPLVAELGLPTREGRLVVDGYLAVPGHPDVVACGDAAAVADLTRPGQLTAMTAQHAVRQGRSAARTVAASLGYGSRRRYRHHDLGFLVDLGRGTAAANLGVALSGFPAAVVTRGYHLLSTPGNRLRIAADWALEAVLPPPAVQLGTVRASAAALETAEPRVPPAPAPLP